MSRRDDLESILVIGSGPIVIGQACEFDYSGAQACRVLSDEGYRVVLANSNPATIMTDPDLADRTYIEPLSVEVLTAIIEREHPDALYRRWVARPHSTWRWHSSTSGAQRLRVEMIGANAAAIRCAESAKSSRWRCPRSAWSPRSRASP